MSNTAWMIETARKSKGRRSDMLEDRMVTQMADRLRNQANTILGNQKYALSTYNNYKKTIITSRNKINVKDFIS